MLSVADVVLLSADCIGRPVMCVWSGGRAVSSAGGQEEAGGRTEVRGRTKDGDMLVPVHVLHATCVSTEWCGLSVVRRRREEVVGSAALQELQQLREVSAHSTQCHMQHCTHWHLCTGCVGLLPVCVCVCVCVCV